MRKFCIVSLVLVAALAVSLDIPAQSPAGAGSAQGISDLPQTIPDLSGIWEAPD